MMDQDDKRFLEIYGEICGEGEPDSNLVNGFNQFKVMQHGHYQIKNISDKLIESFINSNLHERELSKKREARANGKTRK